MGTQCSSTTIPKVSTCIDSRTRSDSCGFNRPEEHGASCQKSSNLSLATKGLVICVDTVDDLVAALPFQMDADLDHLYALPQSTSAIRGGGGGVVSAVVSDNPVFNRDVGTRCEAGDCQKDNQDNFACLVVDDLANPWCLYVVADGSGPAGDVVSALLVHELPGVLVQNPGVHSDSSCALYQSFVSVGEMVSTCQYVDVSTSYASLSAVLLRDGVLHVAWVRDSKVVLGRLAARQSAGDVGDGGGNVSAASSMASTPGHRALSYARPAQKRPGTRGKSPTPFHLPPTTSSEREGHTASPLLLRAVELTAVSIVENSVDGICKRQPSGSGDSVEGVESTDAKGACNPGVRRMRLKSEDVFVVLGTSGLWNRLAPSEVVTIVGQHLHQAALHAADALVAEAERRHSPGARAADDDITVMVLYLQGDRFVEKVSIDEGATSAFRMFDPRGIHVLREARDNVAGCGCVSLRADGVRVTNGSQPARGN
eukprot:TRINITY_DN68866_c0_g1_i1.p1 TRINITY_DN68866_c0_g1~~TRINITY_DN68866_c0_g1_i1.p1  ORF type:complete len:483 (-),score=63.09 TRINITY_DN68866_c0_g1_i1:48-1496(-)